MKRISSFSLGAAAAALLSALVVGCGTRPEGGAANGNAAAGVPAPPPSPAEAAKHFTSCEGSSDRDCLKYSFDYPSSWTMSEPSGRGDMNSVKGQARHVSFTFYPSKGDVAKDRRGHINEHMSLFTMLPSTPRKRISMGPTRIGPYDGFEFRYTEKSAFDESHEGVGRVIYLPRPGGWGLMMIVSSDDPADVKNKESWDTAPEIQQILNSLKLGQ